ncbi:MAG: YciI family protein [Deltaproteobacteria bacterium]|nr:YciI family protein [Deltaproteobacteria bacterium]
MQYLLLIYDNEKVWADMSPEESGKLFGEYMQFSKEIRESGHFIAGEALQQVHTATTVRSRNGKTTTTDGPFAETREQLGGFYMINAKDLDEATAIAARIPSAKIGSIEVRPIQAFEQPAAMK